MNDIPIFWAILAGVIIVVMFVRRFGRSVLIKKTGLGVDVDGDLLRACRDDHRMADRLVQHELDRQPALSRTAAALLALSRLRDDKR
jgi:hypothetical protein